VQFFVSTTREQLRIATQNGGHVRRKDRSDRRWQFMLLFTVHFIDNGITEVKTFILSVTTGAILRFYHQGAVAYSNTKWRTRKKEGPF